MIDRFSKRKIAILLFIVAIFICVTFLALFNQWSNEAKATNKAVFRDLAATGTAETSTSIAKLTVIPPHN